MNYKAGYSGHDAMREKAERAFGSEMRGHDCYKHGGKTHHGRVKKDIGGEIQKASMMGLPGYLSSKVVGGFKHGGKVHHNRVKKDIGGTLGDIGKSLIGMPFLGRKSGGKVSNKPVRKNMGGMMGAPINTADSIQQANQLLSNAASNGTGLKRGGHAHHKHSMRHKRADGGAMNAMGERDFNVGRKAMGFNEGGQMRSGGKTCHREMGGEVKKAIGGVGKIRHGQMTKRGAQIVPRVRFKG